MEGVAEERADPVPERDGFGGRAQVAHGFTAMRAQRLAVADIGVGHAAAAVVNLAFAAMPFGGVAGVVMTIVFHSGSVSWSVRVRRVMMTELKGPRSYLVNL